jgi:hypothetical protein
MFVQVIKGRASDVEGVRRLTERWRKDVMPGATGFLGTTAGVAADGTAIVFARFADEASARANSNRAEQSAWWQEMAKCFDGEPTFRESSDTSLLFDGPSTAAGFVQIMEGTAPDRAKAEATETPEMEAQLREARPDLLGGLRVWFDGGSYLEAAYFTSEDEARKGESNPEFEQPQEEFAAMFGEPTYLDLRNVQHS